MTFNWKKTFIALFDIVIAVYLLLAVSAFNTPAEKATVCTEVKIDINNESIGGFVNPAEIKNILEKTPPELTSDISDRGIVLTGGGALLYGLEDLIEEKTGITTMTAEDPMTAVAVGTGQYVELLGSGQFRLDQE